jgi:hypothetical protein
VQWASHRRFRDFAQGSEPHEHARLAGRDRRYIKGQKHTLLSRKENLTLDGKKALKTFGGSGHRHSPRLEPSHEPARIIPLTRQTIQMLPLRSAAGRSARVDRPSPANVD